MHEDSKLFIPKGFQKMPGKANDVNWDDDDPQPAAPDNPEKDANPIPVGTSLPILASTGNAFFDKRMRMLGVTADSNTVMVWQTEVMSGENQGERVQKPFEIFKPHSKGIEILCVTLDRAIIRYQKGQSRHFNHIYSIIRHEVPFKGKNGKEGKYELPKDQPTMPFFAPQILDKYDAACEWKSANPGKKLPKELRIENLYFTEGYFKAWKGCQHGIDVVAFASITCMKERNGKMYEDVIKLIIAMEVERVIWLTDGDCMNITADDLAKEGEELKDLYTRPKNFYDTIVTFHALLSELNIDAKYFAHINTYELPKTESKELAKGLDDLIINYPGQRADIAREFNSFSAKKKGGEVPGTWITRIEITHNTSRIYKYFHLDSALDFWQYHSAQRKDLAEQGKFKFKGTTYKWDDDKNELKVEIPGEAKNYFLAGNEFFEWVVQPTKFYEQDGSTNTTYALRNQGIIVLRHNKDILKHIPVYKGFTVVPNHKAYNQVVHEHFNRYHPFKHEAEEGECPHIIEFFKHIFGTDTVQGIPRWELGLDYFQLLYDVPQQILPILCLVSEERSTGKTTFGELIDWVFSGNVIFVGNEDLKGDFNAHYVDKLCVVCDETKIDSHDVIQKIKRMSTADSAVMNAKGIGQVTVPFFAKFILMSNSVDDFIRIDEKEIRFWVIKVPALAKTDVHYKKKMRDEIPQFIYFLQRRKMVTEYTERHWFANPLLHTPTLDAVKENSMNKVQKEIRYQLARLFELDRDMHELKMPLQAIVEMCANARVEPAYIRKMLHTMGYTTLPSARIKFPGKLIPKYIQGEPGKKAEVEKEIEWHQHHGAYYLFPREKFITDEAEAVAASEAQPVSDSDLPF